MNDFVIAIDIGSPQKNKKNPHGKLGWFSSDGESGVAENLEKKLHLPQCRAIGIEAPLFIPMTSFTDFTKRRSFDSPKRSWSAGPGACVTAINLPFLMMCLRVVAKNNIEITTDFGYWKENQGKCILIWEAFISGETAQHPDTAKIEVNSENPHMRDAELACQMFQKKSGKELDLENMINLPAIFSNSISAHFVHPGHGYLVQASKRIEP